MKAMEEEENLGDVIEADPVHVEEERLISNVSDAVSLMLQERSVSKAGLARKLGATKPWVTKLLEGQNLTLRTVARVAWHLGYQVNVTVTRIDAASGICECGHTEDDHKLPGEPGLVGCYHRVDRDDPPDPFYRKWCPCNQWSCDP